MVLEWVPPNCTSSGAAQADIRERVLTLPDGSTIPNSLRNSPLPLKVTVGRDRVDVNVRFLLFIAADCPKATRVEDKGVIIVRAMRDWLPTAAYGCELAQFQQEMFDIAPRGAGPETALNACEAK
jgi:hypothetical protein